ncbi:MAG: TVP38/TMEM64 family protein [Roseomonas sp.]
MAPSAVLVLVALAWAFGLHRYLTLEALAAQREALAGLVAARPAVAAFLYVAAYIAVVAFSLPGGAVMTLSGGLLFGAFIGAFLAVLGATIGASVLFLLARSAFAPLVAGRAEGLLGPLRAGLVRDGFFYLLSLRLVPVFPFWLLNLAPALLGMAFAPYLAATFLGIIPGTLVFAGIGAGLDEVFLSGGVPDLGVIFSWGVLLPLLGLALLSLFGAWWRRRRSL